MRIVPIDLPKGIIRHPYQSTNQWSVLLAWAVIANLFLLDGGAWRCLMSRLGLYLSTREYACLVPDSRGLQDLFFGRETGVFMGIVFRPEIGLLGNQTSKEDPTHTP